MPYVNSEDPEVCASVQYDLDSLCSSTYTTISIVSVSAQGRPRSACTNVIRGPFRMLCIK